MFADSDTAIDFVTFAYFLSSSLWLTNLRWLNRDAQKIAFRDIRQPTMAINDRLLDRRHDLALLRTEVQAVCTWIRPKLNTRLELLRAEWAPSPKDAFEAVLTESAALERFLVDTFQLLMSSISVLDSQTSIHQAERSSHLTALATLYVPLSFVTGVFGMNIKEINDSNPSLWTFVVALLVVGACTALFLWMTGPPRVSKNGMTHRNFGHRLRRGL
ncbi:hypothetical protein AC579_5755 [Pseudocercospora musae]|uniref:Uncharacterized protein n=1 Tax=Pseudocercospora musae TaxID=113226 RepID=A0A139IS83_9PEZI|nr:hypothetical protein AC579_5755 [Pseudocercospora musae]